MSNMPAGLPDLTHMTLDDFSQELRWTDATTEPANAYPPDLQLTASDQAEQNLASLRLAIYQADVARAQAERETELLHGSLPQRSVSPPIDIFYPGYLPPSMSGVDLCCWPSIGLELEQIQQRWDDEHVESCSCLCESMIDTGGCYCTHLDHVEDADDGDAGLLPAWAT
ncbi:unnamed protein product [Zymoseptoria tritici ST99CH_3D1]|nr:unnamed protein product [Zymoseptoria tritici ST99CH_3D1]